MIMKTEHLIWICSLLFIVASVFTSGCIQPLDSEQQENVTFNVSSVERDFTREALAETVELSWQRSPYEEYRNKMPNATYFDYLVFTYPEGYEEYCKLELNMSFIYRLQRYDTPYPLDLEYNSTAKSMKFIEVFDPDPSRTIKIITQEEVERNPVLKAHLIDVPGMSVRVLPSEEHWLSDYPDDGKFYFKWNDALYQMLRSII